MAKTRRLVILVTLTAALLWPATALANSVAPPALIVIVNNAPADLTMEAVATGNEPSMSRRSTAWETYFCGYFSVWDDRKPSALRIHTNGESFEVPIDLATGGYSQTFTLDLASRTLHPGKLPWRDALMVALRVALTLLVEGAVFWLFGFRSRGSWIAFLLINLITQGFLNIVITCSGVANTYGAGFTLVFFEVVILIVEWAAFLPIVREKTLARRAAYVPMANLASFFLGIVLIRTLPILAGTAPADCLANSCAKLTAPRTVAILKVITDAQEA